MQRSLLKLFKRISSVSNDYTLTALKRFMLSLQVRHIKGADRINQHLAIHHNTTKLQPHTSAALPASTKRLHKGSIYCIPQLLFCGVLTSVSLCPSMSSVSGQLLKEKEDQWRGARFLRLSSFLKLVCNFTMYYGAAIFSSLNMESSSVYLKACLCDWQRLRMSLLCCLMYSVFFEIWLSEALRQQLSAPHSFLLVPNQTVRVCGPLMKATFKSVGDSALS